MLKFSVVVPVYNTYDYLEKCLNSIVNQKNVKNEFEVIVVNDGTPDNSEEIILRFKKKYPQLIKYIKKENGGLSSARNAGIKESKGEYLIFVDSDDYLDLNLMHELEETIDNNNKPDVIRIDTRDVKETGETIQDVILNKSNNEIDLIKNIMQMNALEVPWAYVYNQKFFIDNKFEYPLSLIHEDFGLTPIVLYKANTICQMSFIGYNYVERENSIIAEKNYEKLKKRVDDFWIHYKKHMNVIKKDSIKGKLLRSYSLEAMLNKLTTLNKEDLEKKLKEIGPYLHVSDLYCYNLKKVIKKVVLMINIKLYLYLYKQYKK